MMLKICVFSLKPRISLSCLSVHAFVVPRVVTCAVPGVPCILKTAGQNYWLSCKPWRMPPATKGVPRHNQQLQWPCKIVKCSVHKGHQPLDSRKIRMEIKSWNHPSRCGTHLALALLRLSVSIRLEQFQIWQQTEEKLAEPQLQASALPSTGFGFFALP